MCEELRKFGYVDKQPESPSFPREPGVQQSQHLVFSKCAARGRRVPGRSRCREGAAFCLPGRIPVRGSVDQGVERS